MLSKDFQSNFPKEKKRTDAQVNKILAFCASRSREDYMATGPNKGTLTEVDTTSVEYIREISAVQQKMEPCKQYYQTKNGILQITKSYKTRLLQKSDKF